MVVVNDGEEDECLAVAMVLLTVKNILDNNTTYEEYYDIDQKVKREWADLCYS